MKLNSASLTLVVTAAWLLMGCMTPSEDHSKRLIPLAESFRQQNQQIALAQGERVLNKDFASVFSAIITALPEVGLSVKNMDRQSGFINAEGPIPLSKDRAIADIHSLIDEMGTASGFKHGAQFYYVPAPEKTTVSLTLSAKPIEKTKTKIRIRIVTKGTPARVKSSVDNQNWDDIYPNPIDEVYPVLHRHILEEIWMRIDRQVFLEEKLDKQ